MNVSLGLLDYLPLPQQPFDKVPTEKQRIVEESYRAIDKRANEFKNESVYAYHPHNQNKIQQGQIVDFIIA
tara:strand:+ start:612 stop:824 length:213 start_codon:yes stop_codon:yes gene_type:complete